MVAEIDLESEFLEIFHIIFIECLKYLGLLIFWDLREILDVDEHIKPATKVFGAVQKNFYGNTNIPFHLQI